MTFDSLTIPLEGQTMRLRPSELASVAAGLDARNAVPPSRLAEALRRMPQTDLASFWELAVRHYARRKPVSQAAGEIGMDVRHAERLLARFNEHLATLPAA